MHKRLGKNTVVLLGVGHTNAHVLRMWKMKPVKNAQLICVSDFPVATYSGMLPAVVSGQSHVEQMEIDLVRLTQACGSRLVIGKVTGLDHDRRELLFADRPPLAFDIMSIGIGSRPTFNGVKVAEDAPLIAVKPMQTFLKRLQDKLHTIDKPAPTITVVGGGLGSIEIAVCLWERFHGKPNHKNVDGDFKPKIQLLTGSKRVGNGLLDSTAEKVTAQFARRGIEILAGHRVAEVNRDRLKLVGGTTVETDLVIWTTSAVAAPLLGQLGLETEERGFLLTEQNLQTTKLDRVFAVGDTGTIAGSKIAKAGVYAVRQGPVLDKNIRALVEGKTQLEGYQPQTGFLKLVNLGNDTAIAEYRGRSFTGGWCWRLKNHIDVKFMRMYQDYTPMAMVPEPPADNEIMKCLGCGGKVGSELLSDVLHELEIPDHEDVKIGLDEPDDAAIVRTHGGEVTVTTDFFAAPLEDPYLVGRIATLNSTSDCFVMGARPTAALAIVQLPEGHPRAQRQVMRELMAGSVEELKKMGATVVGGHTIEGPRIVFGYTVLAKQMVDATTKGRLQVGDQLVLTKPLGTGVLLAAWMQCQMPASCYHPLVKTMLQSNEIALELIQKFPVSAVTDVTGFGLAGHLAEMLNASGVSAKLNVADIPILDGCRELVDAGIESTLAPDNRAVAGKVDLMGANLADKANAVLFDPQTGGGLLFGVAPKDCQAVVNFLIDSGFESTFVVGEVTENSNQPRLQLD